MSEFLPFFIFFGFLGKFKKVDFFFNRGLIAAVSALDIDLECIVFLDTSLSFLYSSFCKAGPSNLSSDISFCRFLDFLEILNVFLAV